MSVPVMVMPDTVTAEGLALIKEKLTGVDMVPVMVVAKVVAAGESAKEPRTPDSLERTGQT